MAESIGGGGEDAVRPPEGPTLSVVVITHNERERIDDCLESVFEVCEPFEEVEVVLVDSRSTDGTVAVARDYPVRILELPAEPSVTPSAGRYVGTAATAGDLVLFVDGDMILADGWLERACKAVLSDPALAGVDGHLAESDAESDADPDASSPTEPDAASGADVAADETPQPPEDRPVDVLRGVALYERAALTEVGGFDPFLQSMEDIDLSFRLDAAGYDLRRLGDVVASHPPRNPEGERRRRWQRGYYHGRGQLFRKYLSRPKLFARLAYRTRLFLAPTAWVATLPLAVLAGEKRGLLAWTAATVAGVAGVTSVQGAEWTADKLEAWGPVIGGTVLGFSRELPSSDEYPIEAVGTVQDAPPTTAPKSAHAT